MHPPEVELPRNAIGVHDRKLKLGVSGNVRQGLCHFLMFRSAFGAVQLDGNGPQHEFEDRELELFLTASTQAAAIEIAQLHEKAVSKALDERVLQLARELQIGLLPRGVPHVDGDEFFDSYDAAEHVGCDYYDYIELPDGRLAIVIADVVGRGAVASPSRWRVESTSAQTGEPRDSLRTGTRVLLLAAAATLHVLRFSPQHRVALPGPSRKLCRHRCIVRLH